MSENNHSNNHQGGGHHGLPFDLYIKIFAALIFLTVITVWIAQFDFGMFTGVVAMGIATLKASLVGMYFMNLKQDNRLYTVILITAVAFLLLLYGFSDFDIVTRAAEESTL